MSTTEKTITVTVQLRSLLRKYRPETAADGPFSVELAAGSTVDDLVDRLGVPRDMAKLVFVEHAQLPRDEPLTDGVTIEIFPPIGGG